ncbi:MAG: hypothetical protein R2861_10080 [Desulfobacterales bacterium]
MCVLKNRRRQNRCHDGWWRSLRIRPVPPLSPEGFDDSLFEVIPGMGAFNAAGAALKRSLTPVDARFVMLTSPQSMFGENWEK